MSSGEEPREQDHYRVLGVGEDATSEEITQAWRRLAHRYHPDHDPGPDASQRFADLVAAYDVLRDPSRRHGYDAARQGGGGRRIPVRHGGAPGTGAEVRLRLAQAVLGAAVQASVDTEEPCDRCGGGASLGMGPTCRRCGGHGWAVRWSGGIAMRLSCRACQGRGRLAPAPCPACRGVGTIPATRTVSVEVPPGTEDGDRLVPREAGNLRLTARVQPDPRFSRRGRDLRVVLPLTLAEAALGATVEVPTLDGPSLRCWIPPGTGHGATFRLRGWGVPDDRDRGDLVVQAELVVPTALTPAQRAALEAFAAATASPRAPTGDGPPPSR
ncbi:MAG TPA: J domain-containing protein [Acidimicrobiales bacterium]|nr:J domain-containing protein [Acidimicrobiales bacterium]